jgi:hypothetical protein
MGVRIAGVVFVAMCTGQVALAGGIEVPPNFYDWTGVYVGANGGYGSGSITDSVNGTQAFSGAIAGGKLVPICSTDTLCLGWKSTATGRISKAPERLCPPACRGLRRHAYASDMHTIIFPTTRPAVQGMRNSRAAQLTVRSPLQRARHGSQEEARNPP